MALIQILHPLPCMILGKLLNLSSVKWGNTISIIDFYENIQDFMFLVQCLAQNKCAENFRSTMQCFLFFGKLGATLRILRKVEMYLLVYFGGSVLAKAEHQRIDAFELWCWRRCQRVPWTAKRSNQSILKEISLGCSLEGLMLKLKLQYFGLLMRKTDSLEKILMLG